MWHDSAGSPTTPGTVNSVPFCAAADLLMRITFPGCVTQIKVLEIFVRTRNWRQGSEILAAKSLTEPIQQVVTGDKVNITAWCDRIENSRHELRQGYISNVPCSRSGAGSYASARMDATSGATYYLTGSFGGQCRIECLRRYGGRSYVNTSLRHSHKRSRQAAYRQHQLNTEYYRRHHFGHRDVQGLYSTSRHRWGCFNHEHRLNQSG